MRSKCPGENTRRPSAVRRWSMALSIVGYVENTMRLVAGSSLFSSKLHSVSRCLKNSVKLYETGLRDSVDELIVASDMVVFPSTSVHQPRPCIEAGAYEKPVIISDYPETTEYFKEGYNALIFKPGDSGELAQKIEYAYSHRKEMEEMGKRNRAMTETKHDFYDCKAKICSLIEKVCNNAN